ncbi:MAG: hypothetical protein AB3N13_10930 [Arenibacterium sp.]
MSTLGMTAILIQQMLMQKAEKEAQKVLNKEAKSFGDAIAKSVTQDVLDSGPEQFIAKQVKKHLPKTDKIVLGAVAGQFKKIYNAEKLPPDPSGYDPTKLKVFGPVPQPKPLSSGKLHATIPIPLKKLKGPKGKKVILDVWLGVDQGKLMKQEWNGYGGARLRF